MFTLETGGLPFSGLCRGDEGFQISAMRSLLRGGIVAISLAVRGCAEESRLADGVDLVGEGLGPSRFRIGPRIAKRGKFFVGFDLGLHSLRLLIALKIRAEPADVAALFLHGALWFRATRRWRSLRHQI